MNYNMIYNNPVDRRRSTYPYVLWDNCFSEQELSEIQKLENSFDFSEAETFNGSILEKNQRIRKSKINFFSRNNENNWVFDRFNTIIKSINDEFYGFELNGYNQIQYTIYNSEDEGTYGWHMDTLLGKNINQTEETRKLTLVMLLSDPRADFVGGEFQMNLSNEENAETIFLTKGKLIAFPSWMIHRVKPVIRGIRKSLVIWVEGPKFK